MSQKKIHINYTLGGGKQVDRQLRGEGCGVQADYWLQQSGGNVDMRTFFLAAQWVGNEYLTLLIIVFLTSY